MQGLNTLDPVLMHADCQFQVLELVLTKAKVAFLNIFKPATDKPFSFVLLYAHFEFKTGFVICQHFNYLLWDEYIMTGKFFFQTALR